MNMPTYEYACAACGHEWDQVQRITEPPVELCPKCAKSAAHRLISGGTNFILKGGGWYSDLYASPKQASKKPDAKGESTSETGGKAETKSDGKNAPAASATAAPATPASSSSPATPSPSSSS
jgi:putative FmdB family regulatory protein